MADIGDDQCVAAVARIDLRQGARKTAAIELLRQFFSVFDPEQTLPERRVAADNGGGAIMAAPDIMGEDQRPEERPGVNVLWMVNHLTAPFLVTAWNGLTR